MLSFYNIIFDFFSFIEKKANFPSNIVSTLNFTIRKLRVSFRICKSKSLSQVVFWKSKTYLTTISMQSSNLISKIVFLETYFLQNSITTKWSHNERFPLPTCWSLYQNLFWNCCSSFEDFKLIPYFLVHVFFPLDSFSLSPYLYDILKFLFKDASSEFDLFFCCFFFCFCFSKLCGMEN